MEGIYSEILNSFKTNKASVLATIIRQKGTSPRGVGAKMLIMEDGTLSGSVGGGILEKSVIDISSGVFSSSLPMHFMSDPGMSCGGDVEIFLEPVSPDNDICSGIYKEITGIINGADQRSWRLLLIRICGRAVRYIRPCLNHPVK